MQAFIVKKHISHDGHLHEPSNDPKNPNIIDGSKFPDLHRLVKLGAIEPCEGVEIPPQPPTLEEAQDDIEVLHQKLMETEQQLRDALSVVPDAEGKLQALVDELRKEVEATHVNYKSVEGLLIAEKNKNKALEKKVKSLQRQLAKAGITAERSDEAE